MVRDIAFSLFVAAAFVALALLLFFPGASSDLLAVWMAGAMFAAGETGQVYAADPDLFTMRPPEGWAATVAATGFEGRYFPYLYPPLWAALVAPLTSLAPWPAFAGVAGAVNAALLAATALLAARAARPAMPRPLFAALALAALSTSTVGLLAMFENQPQILVTFLLVLCIERHVAGAPRAAGMALALAAAIKLYPALFILVWILRRDWAFARAFALTGAALAALSVLLAGWPLHTAFLDQLGTISRTVLVTGQSLNIDTLLALLTAPEALEPVAATHMPAQGPDAPGWRIMARPALWQVAGMAALVATLVLIARRPATAARFAAMMTLAAIFSPMAWGYYYMPLLFLLPLLPDRLGWKTGGALALLVLLPTLLPLSGIWPANLAFRIGLTLLGFAIGAIALLRSDATLNSPNSGI